MFNKIIDFFVDKNVKNEIKKNPLYLAALLASESALKETGLDKHKDKIKVPATELANDITSILMAEDQFLSMRQKFAESVLVYARYQVLVNNKEDEDPGGLVGLPGITGEIRKHLVKIGETDSLIKQELHGRTDVPDELTLTFMKEHVRAKYLIWYWRQSVFNTLRVGLKDNNPNVGKDWMKHFFYSVCVCHEYDFRFELKLKENISYPQKLMNSTFLEIVLSGEKYPDLAFYEKYKEEIDSKQLFFKKNWK